MIGKSQLQSDEVYHSPSFVFYLHITTKMHAHVIGVVLYIGDIRSVDIAGRGVSVRDIMIVDESTQYPLRLSAWGDLAEADFEIYTNWSIAYKIVSFMAMRIKTFNGFTLSSSMSTEITTDPAHDRTLELCNWAEANKSLLDDLQSMILTARDSSQPRVISTIAEIKAKKAMDTWFEQKFWLKVVVVDPKMKDLYFYMGCSKCGRKGPTEKGISFFCNHCKVADTKSVPRVSFKIKVSDSTGTHEFTVFTREAQTLIGFTCEQMHEYFVYDDETQLNERLQELATKEVYLQIGPTTTVAANRMLSWVIRNISFE